MTPRILKKHPLSITIATITGLCAINNANAIVQVPQTPFAHIPLNLQQQTTTSIGGKPPKSNMMLFIDDSGSMDQDVNGVYYSSPTKMTITKRVLKKVLDKYKDDFNWDLHTLWGTENRTYSGIPKGFVDSEKMKVLVDRMYPDSNTPTTQHYVSAIQDLMDAQKYRCQKSYMIMMSDGEANSYTRNTLRNPYNNYFLNSNNYWGAYWKSKGYPTYQRNFRWGSGDPLGLGYGQGISFYSETAANRDFKRGGSTDADGIDWDDPGPDPQNPLDKQTITTYTIGFGTGIKQDACRYLRNAATANPKLPQPSDLTNEPDCPQDNKGRFFFSASKEQELLDAFDSALSQSPKGGIGLGSGKETVSTSTPATAGSKIPELAAYLTLDTKIWASVLYFNKIDSSGNIDNKIKNPPLFSDKHQILVNTGTKTHWISDTSNDFYGIKKDEELKTGIIPWLERPSSITDEQIEKDVASAVPAADRTVKEYRKRTDTATDILRQMADVIGSPIISMEKDTNTGKEKYLVTAANDGLVYIFKRTNNNAKPYELALNYLPGAMQRESIDLSDTVAKALPAIAEAGYGRNVGQPHLYLNDGGIVYRTTGATAGAGKQSFIVGAMGKGGRGVYALNIGGKSRLSPTQNVGLDAGPGNYLKEVPLWETEKGKDNAIGYTVGTPQIGQIATQWNIPPTSNPAQKPTPKVDKGVRFYAFFGNGYPTNDKATQAILDKEPTLYAYEALGQEAGTDGAAINGDAPGTQVAKISIANGYGGLASPTLVDTDFDGIVDIGYAGDYGGNLYRFDFRDSPSKWKAVQIYQGLNTSSTSTPIYSQPITAAPAVYRRNKNEFVVIFGTGSDLYQADLSNTDQQAVIGIFDDVSKAPTSVPSYSDLDLQTITNTTKDKRFLSNNSVDLTKSKGWKLELDKANGERVVVKPDMLLSTAFLTTRSYKVAKTGAGSNPNSSNSYTCLLKQTTVETDGESWLMAINALSGGTPDSTVGAYFTSAGKSVGGIKTEGLSSQVTLYDKNSNTILATTPNGDAGGNGNGAVLLGQGSASNLPPQDSNKCLMSDGYQALYSDSTGAKNTGITGLICPQSIIRLNYREISL